MAQASHTTDGGATALETISRSVADNNPDIDISILRSGAVSFRLPADQRDKALDVIETMLSRSEGFILTSSGIGVDYRFMVFE